jgi:hypothetical protein
MEGLAGAPSAVSGTTRTTPRDALMRCRAFIVEGPDGALRACRWTSRPEHAFRPVGFEAIVHGSAVGDFGVFDPRSGEMRLPARWGDATAILSDVVDMGADLDVCAGRIVIARPVAFTTNFG